MTPDGFATLDPDVGKLPGARTLALELDGATKVAR
jgi:hypothetical protein